MEQDVNTGKRKLTIRHLGPIRSADICLKYVNVVIGEQSSGKSCLLKTACYCTWVEKRIEIEQIIDLLYSWRCLYSAVDSIPQDGRLCE